MRTQDRGMGTCNSNIVSTAGGGKGRGKKGGGEEGGGSS
jgi:hypothetical protein